ncbi:MAG: ComF family protein [Pirellulales bacterium]
MRRNLRKQSELRFSARWQNVHQAFVVKRGYDIQGAKVLLVDDILTSGATASEAARVLKKAGAAEVIVAVAGRALFQNTTK